MSDTEPTTWYLRNFKFELGQEATDWVPYSYNWNESLTTDVSGNNYSATKIGTLTLNKDTPRYENSILFGTNALLDSPAGAVLAASKDFTISGWFNRQSGTTYYASKESYNTSICLENARYFIYPASGSASVGTWSCTDNTWQHIVLVHDSVAKTLSLYVNGVYQSQVATDGTVYANSTLDIGGRQSGHQFNGSISDFRVYATALSANDVLTMYKNSGIIDNKNNIYAYEFKEE
jgi:hypothetical protein